MPLKLYMFTPGLKSYWNQMPGSKEEIEGYAAQIQKRLSQFGEVKYFGIVDNVQYAREVENEIIKSGPDLIFLHAGTYGLSKNILHVLRRCNVPIVTIHAQPIKNFNRESKSSYTIPKNAFSISGEMGAVLKRMGKTFVPLAGHIEDDSLWNRVSGICACVRIVKKLQKSNIAFLGNFYHGMYDIYTDITQLSIKFGVNIELLEFADVHHYLEEIKDKDVEAILRETEEHFELEESLEKEKLYWPCKVGAALNRFVNDRNIHAIAYHYLGYPGSVEEKIAYSMTLGASLLTGRGIPCSVEGDLALSIPLLIMRELGAGASQTEINVADFDDEVIFLSHSGPGDISISEEKPYLKWLDFFHGRRGSGVSCEFGIKNGPVTILSLTKDARGYFFFVTSEGEAVAGKRLENGNVNTRIKFNHKVGEFVERWAKAGPTHHCAIGIGHHAQTIQQYAEMIGIECHRI